MGRSDRDAELREEAWRGGEAWRGREAQNGGNVGGPTSLCGRQKPGGTTWE